MRADLPAGCSLIELSVKGDERGSLIAIESFHDIPFAIARAYFIYATRPNVARGFHAHRNLKQLAVAVSGSCTMTVDDGRTRASVKLDRPDVALTIPHLVWREMRDFSPDCVLLVLADSLYDEADYIRDYQEFLKAVDE